MNIIAKKSDKRDLKSLIAETEKNRIRLKELFKKCQDLDATINSQNALMRRQARPPAKKTKP
jgi:hypothetical protein